MNSIHNPKESSMIVVTGANGQLGGLIVEQLLKRVPATEVGVSVRDTDQAAAVVQDLLSKKSLKS